MNLEPHPETSIQRLAIGLEQAPLLVIDNVVANADELVELAASKRYGDVVSHYPGIRAKAPLLYHQFVLGKFGALFAEFFALQGRSLRITACHFSLVTTPPQDLEHLQRIPHIDSVLSTELAFIHYLFKRDLGGTAFYRHRYTGFEVVNRERRDEYFARVYGKS